MCPYPQFSPAPSTREKKLKSNKTLYIVRPGKDSVLEEWLVRGWESILSSGQKRVSFAETKYTWRAQVGTPRVFCFYNLWVQAICSSALTWLGCCTNEKPNDMANSSELCSMTSWTLIASACQGDLGKGGGEFSVSWKHVASAKKKELPKKD